ncbi:putative uncharacterized protein DDB_G0282133 [Chrysoperla carnea]|uniref:putative uncharacterized protein DDB_G0282133 n=1 Tax=Chrysoperla carnea TaxID=189513 RepID=UPI001D096983|nr:putative uncharacterized protein DDB_G0282133 [Chrysoperla carnea]
MSNTLEEKFEKMDPQETILKSSFKMDKKITKIDEQLSGVNHDLNNVLNKNNPSDLSDISDILKYETASITNESCAGTSGFNGGATSSGGGRFIDSNSSNNGPVSRKQLRFPDDYDDYEDDDSINNFATDGVHKTLSMTNRYDPDEASTDTLHQQRSSICNISIHSQAMGGSAGIDIPSTASESGTKGSKAFTNNTTSISSSTISSSDQNNRQQCSLAAAGTSERNDYNFLVKSISQIENFSTIANHNNNKRTEPLNHSASQPDNLSTYFINDNNNNNNTTVSSLHSTMEAILNVHRTQQYYTTNSDLEPFNNNQKSILTIHPQYRLLVSDTNSPAIIESTIYGNNGHPEQLITQQLNNEYPILSRHSSTETIQSKLSAMQLNEYTVMGTLSSNVSQQQTNKEEKLNGKESNCMFTMKS